MTDFDGKVVVITGGRSGIGAACAAGFAERGAHVITAQRGPDAVHDHIVADFMDPAVPARIVNDVLDRAGRLDVLVNNAGLMHEGSLTEIDPKDWAATLQVNLTAPAMLIRESLPYLCAVQGSIVNIGSIEGIGSNPRHPAYCASKGGLHALTRAVAVDHGPDRVRCNAVAPGWIDTDLNEDFIASLGDPAEFRRKIGKIHPLRRTGAAQEVAELVLWLASDAASFVTGQIWTIDGGRTAQLSLP